MQSLMTHGSDCRLLGRISGPRGQPLPILMHSCFGQPTPSPFPGSPSGPVLLDAAPAAPSAPAGSTSADSTTLVPQLVLLLGFGAPHACLPDFSSQYERELALMTLLMADLVTLLVARRRPQSHTHQCIARLMQWGAQQASSAVCHLL